jgi:hypothetical protein
MKKLAVLVACAAIPWAHAQKSCSPADMQKAQKAIDMVVTWQQLNKSWKDWRQCDTGDVADTYTDALLRLMVEWKNVDALADSIKDPEYKGFVETHLRSPAAAGDLSMVRSRATLSCPKGQDAVCKEIAAATESAKPVDLSPMAPMAPAAATPPK